jgi:hypothetical protein
VTTHGFLQQRITRFQFERHDAVFFPFRCTMVQAALTPRNDWYRRWRVSDFRCIRLDKQLPIWYTPSRNGTLHASSRDGTSPRIRSMWVSLPRCM